MSAETVDEKEKRCVQAEAEFLLERRCVKWRTIRKWTRSFEDEHDEFEVIRFDRVPSHLLSGYARVLEETENAMPTEIVEPYYRVTPDDVQEEEERLGKEGERILSIVVCDVNDRIVALSRFLLSAVEPSYCRQWQIGVTGAHRGIGLGTYLMAITHRHLFEEYAGLRSIGSDTHPSNRRMIRIMKGLGYRYLCTRREWE